MSAVHLTSTLALCFLPGAGFGQSPPEICNKEDSRCIFVATYGTTTATGSFEQPFNSLISARNRAREIRASSPDWINIHIYLRQGIYRLKEPLVLGAPQDGGTDVGLTEWTAFPGESATISGANTRVVGIDFDKPGIYKVADIHSQPPPREAFLNDARIPRSRWPNAPLESTIQYWYGRPGSQLSQGKDDRKITVKNSKFPNNTNLLNTEFYIFREFSLNILRVLDVSQTREVTDVYFNPYDTAAAFDQKFPRKWENQSYHLENSINFLDTLGEWYIDPSTGVFSMYLDRAVCDKTTTCKLDLPAAQTLLKISGHPKGPLKNLRISDLNFRHTSWIDFPGGYIPGQAGVYTTLGGVSILTPGAIEISYAQNIKVSNCHLKDLGTHAIVVRKGVRDLDIFDNKIEDGSAGGIYIDTLLSPAATIDDSIERIIVANNKIRHIGLTYADSVAIFSGYAGKVTIEGNTIVDTPYSAISVGWGWTERKTSLHNNRISNNQISNAMNKLTDGGGIYLLSRQDDTLVNNNNIQLTPSIQTSDFDFLAGIYLDQGVSGVTVSGNEVKILKSSTKGRHISYFDQTGNSGNAFKNNR